MAKEKKFVEAITSRDEDFAKWYTDVVKKAGLADYSSVRGCMILRPNGYAIWENIQKNLTVDLRRQELKMFICLFSFLRVFSRRKRIMWKASPRGCLGYPRRHG